MKLLEEAKYFRKEPVHDSYASIVEDFKDYEKVSEVQMIKEIELHQRNITLDNINDIQ